MTDARLLEEALEEIRASAEGPTVGAFFDFDGTLIAGYSAMHLSAERFRSRDVGFAEVTSTISVGARAAVKRAGFEDVLRIGAHAWKGRRDDDLQAMGDRVFQGRVSDLVYPEARELVAAHRDRGHTVVLSSSATEYQVDPMARFLGVDHVLCNRYAKDDGSLTGELEMPVIWGPSKATAVEAFAGEHGIDLADSWFYADGDEDVALMRVVGHPRPTNPASGLAAAAVAEGWPTLRFTSRSARSLDGRLKQVASGVALLAAAVGGGAVALARRDRQEGANFVTRHWLPAVFAINGVEVRVHGKDHLHEPRPAVFVYNHRNNVDGFVAASLVGHDFVAVGDAEVADHPLVARLARLSDITFLEGADREEAVARLVSTAAEGRSVLIAPEGVRVDTTTVGPFEPDAFRIAADAGVPIIPIVIRNADRIAGRGASVMVGGVLDVAVLAPIDADRGRTKTVEHLASTVHRAFIDTLTSWPTST